MRQIFLTMLVAPFAFSIAGAQASEPKDVELISIELSSFAFSPSDLVFQHDRTYHLRLVNTSSGGHDFAARTFFSESKIAPEDMAKVVNGKVELHGGEVVDITLTPTNLGTFELHCSHFMHGVFGMHGKINVK